MMNKTIYEQQKNHVFNEVFIRGFVNMVKKQTVWDRIRVDWFFSDFWNLS